jgi:DNA repair protein RadC
MGVFMSIADLAPSDRPRERLLAYGARALRDAELLATVLGTAPGGGALRAADELLQRFPDLRRMADAGVAELAAVPGVGRAQACRVKAALALASRLCERPFVRGDSLDGPRDVFEKIGRRLRLSEREAFVALALDVKHRVIAPMHVADGGFCSVQFLPRDVFATLVREAAAGVVFVHNHPSGDPSPSIADRELTQRLTAAGALVGIQVLDHMIVAMQGYHTFSEGRTVRVDGG